MVAYMQKNLTKVEIKKFLTFCVKIKTTPHYLCDLVLSYDKKQYCIDIIKLDEILLPPEGTSLADSVEKYDMLSIIKKLI